MATVVRSSVKEEDHILSICAGNMVIISDSSMNHAVCLELWIHLNRVRFTRQKMLRPVPGSIENVDRFLPVWFPAPVNLFDLGEGFSHPFDGIGFPPAP